MLIWTNRNTEDGVGDNNYYFKENYWEMRNPYFQTKKKLDQTILELHGI